MEEQTTRVTFGQSTDRVDAYDFVEVVVQLADSGIVNPFTEARLTGSFGPPEGPKRIVDGFCDAPDGSVFRIRFMPCAPGEYDFAVCLREPGGRAHEHVGRFEAVDGRRKGTLRVDPEYPWHFVWEGTGEHYFYNGTTAYWLLGWDDETIRQAIDRLANLKVNRVRLLLSGRVHDGKTWWEAVYPTDRFTFCLNPWPAADPASVENPHFDVTRFNVAYWQKAERLLAWARKRDVTVSIIFYGDGFRPGADPFGDVQSEDELRYYRYAVARFGAFANVTWDLANEYRLFRSDAWAEWIGRFVDQIDPYDHLTSVHGFGDFRFHTAPWADFALYQTWDHHGGNAFMLKNRALQAKTGRVMPQVNEEYCYEEHYPGSRDGRRVEPTRDADSRRRIAWEIAMAGCYQTTGERADTGTGALADTGGGWINGRGDASMTMLEGYGHMVDFFTSFPWWRAEPCNELVKRYEGARFAAIPYFTTGSKGEQVQRTGPALCLAEEGETYAIYLPAGGKVAVEVTFGRYDVRRFDPRRGEWTALGPVESAGGTWETPSVPDDGDWAFLLRRHV